MSDTQGMVHFTLFSTPFGNCGIAWRENAVVAANLPEATAEATAARLAARTGGTAGSPTPEIQYAIAAIKALLEGGKTDLNFIACDFSRTDPFAAKVYAATRAIPPGQTLTYGDVARRLGDKQLAQAVGQALGRNPIPIIVPCHRVLGANGKLTGFSATGGVETKLRLLEIEGAQIGAAPGLFDDLPLSVKAPNRRR
ncbi:MAG: MGMT family protein [Henriciella sp.]